MAFTPRLALALLLAWAIVASACSSEPGSTASPSPAPATVVPTLQPPPSLTPAPQASPPPEASPSPEPSSAPTTPPATQTPAPPTDHPQPTGFPIDPATPLLRVVGEPGSRSLDYTGGITASRYSLDVQPSDDPDAANAMGWNCRLHVEYEGLPAVDWYVATGTAVHATMDGLASLYVISLPNAFDYYGVDREPYIGNPDRARAPLSPFPGPGGGKGVFVEVVNSDFATEYGHLDLAATLEVVPTDRYPDPYSATFDYDTAFSQMRAFDDETLIATWRVNAGDVIGYTGDSGYSEAPHLHYTVRRLATGQQLCPTEEPGFEDAGWLTR